jgi:hypothetical protein
VPDETWSWRERPLLEIAVREADRGHNPGFEELAEETRLGLRQVSVGIRALQDAGYLTAYFAGMDSGVLGNVTERARREIGTWPSPESLVDQLARALAEAAERETEPERKTKLRAAAEGIAGAGRSIALELVTAFFRQQAHLP